MSAVQHTRARGARLFTMLALLGVLGVEARGDDLEPVRGVELQPFLAQVERLGRALEFIGAPLLADERARLAAASELPEGEAVLAIQALLAPRVLLAVHVNPESRVKVAAGPATPELVQGGWRAFLVRVHNEAGTTAPLRVSSPNSLPVHIQSDGAERPAPGRITKADLVQRWAEARIFDRRPLKANLSGLELEYRILELHARDAGRREATLAFDVGQGTQELGFEGEVSVLFECAPATTVVLDLRDFDGSETVGSFVIRDARERVYPSPSRRLEPDFFFHPQVYRATGETVLLPPGEYTVAFGRGPEYLNSQRKLVVSAGVTEQTERFELRRWIHPRALGWYSGDHHIHAAGCAHYDSPSEGVTPAAVLRHLVGEDINVGCALSWGPCWYRQKQFFEGGVSTLSQPNHLLRYDVEVSGFPSSHAGHLCLLRLREDDYPGTTRLEEWPSFGLPILRWAREQGAVVGYAHSGIGLQVESDELPNYIIPPFDGVGANEYIVTVAHDLVDFISGVDTPSVSELNIWYHTLNCGFRTRLSGETDFPCLYGERVGLGRVYCKLDGGLDFDSFVEALRDGRSYVSDGKSHLLDFRVDSGGNETAVGVDGSELALEQAGTIVARVSAAVWLDEEPRPEIGSRPYNIQPYWHPERARIGTSRKVPVELVVNGQAVARQELLADGTLRELRFEVPLARSSWVAVRVLPSAHTNPVFVLVGGQPIRASARSARWCLESVERCWSQKERGYRASEREEARRAYDAAKATYQRVLDESQVE